MQHVNNLPRRDFYAITGSLIAMTILSWMYLIQMARDMSGPKSCCLIPTHIQGWTAPYFGMMFIMWAIMMIGMMLPTAAPMILIYAAVARKAQKQQTPIAKTAAFSAGYIFMWIIFSFFATVFQWQLDKFALLSPMMVTNSPKIGAALLMAAGIYQLLPIKNNCLKHCQSPFHFISNHWRPGNLGAFFMGISHGAYCIGCCWVIMLLLFVGGVMNILWIAAITIFVLLEKILPMGGQGGKVSGILMIVVGIIMLLKSF
jgi:predicted metal-binding membrane protein